MTKKDLENKTQEELISFIQGVLPDIDAMYEEYLMWRKLPFIPEDLGFTEYESDTEKGVVRVYYREGTTCTRIKNGWIITKGKEKITMSIKSKFHAYQILTGIGLKLDHNDSTVKGLEKPISDIIAPKE